MHLVVDRRCPDLHLSFHCGLALQGTQRAKFSAATMGALMREADAGSPESSGDWVICDPLTFIAALDPSVVTAGRRASCRIELREPERRGQSVFIFNSDGPVQVLQSLEMTRIATLLEQSLT